MTQKVYVEGFDSLICQMFVSAGWTVVDNLFLADLLCLEGGADVTPSLYGHENTDSQNHPTKDDHSFGLISFAHYHLGIPVVGICRGSQVINVFNGGTMKQHINGHGGSHDLDYDGDTYRVTSTHHQESVPHPDVDERCVWRAPDGVCEAVVYPDKRMLGVQFHPEYVGPEQDCYKLFFKMLDKIL